MRKYEVSINNKQYSVVVKKYTQQDAELEINGTPYMVKLDAPVVAPTPQVQPMQPAAVQPVQPQPVQPQPAPAPAAAAPVEGETVTAPIPGSILEILVKVGDAVKAGQTVLKMEAMKMENDINANSDGVVQAINVAVGDAVNQGQNLMVIG